jgi:hypothetical protein
MLLHGLHAPSWPVSTSCSRIPMGVAVPGGKDPGSGYYQEWKYTNYL